MYGLNRVPRGEFYVNFTAQIPSPIDDEGEDDLFPDGESISTIQTAVRKFEGGVVLEKDIFPPKKRERAWGISGRDVDPDDVALRIWQINGVRMESNQELAEAHEEAIELEKEVEALVKRRGW